MPVVQTSYHRKNFLLKILNESRLLLNIIRGILLFKTESLFASALRPTFFWFDFLVMNFDCLEVYI